MAQKNEERKLHHIALTVEQVEKAVKRYTQRKDLHHRVTGAVFYQYASMCRYLAGMLDVTEGQLVCLEDGQDLDNVKEAETFLAGFVTMLGVIDPEIFGDLLVDSGALVDSGDSELAVAA